LASKKLYPIYYRRLEEPIPLNTTDAELLLRNWQYDELERPTRPRPPICSKCGPSACVLHRHIREFFVEENEYCFTCQKFRRVAPRMEGPYRKRDGLCAKHHSKSWDECPLRSLMSDIRKRDDRDRDSHPRERRKRRKRWIYR
jgi:hypothetical protein